MFWFDQRSAIGISLARTASAAALVTALAGCAATTSAAPSALSPASVANSAGGVDRASSVRAMSDARDTAPPASYQAFIQQPGYGCIPANLPFGDLPDILNWLYAGSLHAGFTPQVIVLVKNTKAIDAQPMLAACNKDARGVIVAGK